MRALFVKAVTCAGKCAACGRPGACDAHHVLDQKLLKKLGLHHLLWDVRNGIPLGRSACHCHESHTNRSHPVPRSALPPAAWEFAAEIDQTWRLERVYPA
jgi:hypothetical protein